jgi:chromosome segregation ATPase
MINFLSENGIRDMSDVVGKAESMYDESRSLNLEVKKVDRRLDTLKMHLSQENIYEKYKGLYKRYSSLDRKRRDTFYSKHKKELDSYIKSHEYLTKVLNGKKGVPAKAWKAEYSELTAKRYSYCEKYYNLRTEIKSVEQLQRSAMGLIQGIQMERKPQRMINLER